MWHIRKCTNRALFYHTGKLQGTLARTSKASCAFSWKGFVAVYTGDILCMYVWDKKGLNQVCSKPYISDIITAKLECGISKKCTTARWKSVLSSIVYVGKSGSTLLWSWHASDLRLVPNQIVAELMWNIRKPIHIWQARTPGPMYQRQNELCTFRIKFNFSFSNMMIQVQSKLWHENAF